jgi:two-component system, OmpR family, sensor histidine kinase ArlS
MKRIWSMLNRLPLKYRMMLVSSCMLLLFIALSSVIQYAMLSQQLLHQEKEAITRTMKELQTYYQEKQQSSIPEQIQNSRTFIESMQQPNQLIRILDQNGSPILTLSDHFPDNRLKPQAAAQTQLVSEWHETDHLLIMRSPLTVGAFQGTIEIIRNLEPFDQMEDAVMTALFLSGGGAIAVSIFGALYLVRQLLHPMRSVIDTMKRIRSKGFQERVEIPEQRDELTELAVMFNGMMDQVEHALKQQQQFIEDASHELRTPIAILEGHLSLLNRWGKDNPDVLKDSLQASVEEMTRLKELVLELLELTRADAAEHAKEIPPVEPEAILGNWISHFQTIHPDFSFDIHLEAVKGVQLRILPRHLEQIHGILLDNAVKYSRHHKRISIEGERLQDGVELRIRDYGIGIPPEDLPHVFRRFYRADKARSREMGGSGLGLSIAERLVRLYGGSIRLVSKEGEGTLAIVRFPLANVKQISH